MELASSAMKIVTIDDRYWMDESPCWKCKCGVEHKKSNNYSPSCSVYPREIPPDIWNNKKTCPKWEAVANRSGK